jgi:hypothetical protein
VSAEQTVRIDGVTAANGELPTSYNYVATPPPKSTVLAGSVTDDSAAITIPANSIWFGFVVLSAALNGASQSSTITVNTTDAASVPAPSVNLASLTLTVGATDTGKNDVVSTPFFHVYSGASPTSLDVSIDGAAIVAVTAYGYVMPA